VNLLIGLTIDAAIIAGVVFSGYSGAKRGLVIVGLELVSFFVAAELALLGYATAGSIIKSIAHITVSLGNIAAFVLIWVVSEIASALIIRFVLLARDNTSLHRTLPLKIGGAVLGVIKTTAIITLGLIVFAGLPFSVAAKSPVTQSFIAANLLNASGPVKSTIAAGLGHDLNASLNFYTVTAEPESEQTIQLGFTTTHVTVDTKDEAAMLILLNHERTSRGLNALTPNLKAQAVARSYSAEMFARGYFSHITPEGKNPFDRMKAAHVPFDSAGENLALAPTLQLAHSGLMKSPGHRANILSTSYRTVGIGIIDGGPYGLMVTQDFTD